MLYFSGKMLIGFVHFCFNPMELIAAAFPRRGGIWPQTFSSGCPIRFSLLTGLLFKYTHQFPGQQRTSLQDNNFQSGFNKRLDHKKYWEPI